MTPEEVAAARHELGLTVSEMAEALRLAMPNGRTTVREWENGRREITGPASVAIELMLKLRRRRIDGSHLIEAIRQFDDEDPYNASRWIDTDNPPIATLDGDFDLVRIAEIINDILERTS